MDIKKAFRGIGTNTYAPLTGSYTYPPSGAYNQQLAVMVQAQAANSGNVVVGTVEAGSIDLKPAAVATLFVYDLNEIYVQTTGSDKVNVTVEVDDRPTGL